MSDSRRFSGVARIYGDAALQHFAGAHVCVIGVGGVGSWTVEALARSGIGTLTLADTDHVAVSNINRQLPALESTLGAAKTAVLAQRCRDINPAIGLHSIDAFITAENVMQHLDNRFDFVVECADAHRDKAAIIHHCRRNKIRLLTVGGAGGKTDPAQICCSDLSRTRHDPLLSKVRRLLRQSYGFSRTAGKRFDVPAVWSAEQPLTPPTSDRHATNGALTCAGGLGSLMPVTAGFGLQAAAAVLQRLARQTRHG